MNEHDVVCQVREAFSGLRMDIPVEKVFATSRARRRRRLSGLLTVTALTAGAAAALTLNLGGSSPARSGHPALANGAGQSAPESHAPVRLDAFSLTSGPGDSTTLILHKGPQYQPLDPGELRQALARHGIPALVTVGTFCRSTPAPAVGLDQVVRPATLPDGSDEMVINGSAMPAGTQLSIGLFPGHDRMLLIEDGARLTCGSDSDQPAAHITPAGNAIRG
jgi:hypothetical protein